MTPLVRSRLASAATHAQTWLRGVDTEGLESAPRALHELAVQISSRRMCFHEVVEGSGEARLRWRPLSALVTSTRPALLRFLLRAITARAIGWSGEPADEEQRAGELGALGLSYAREQDLTVACAALQVAGRLRHRQPFLDELACFVLDQQTSSGSFGLIATSAAERESITSLTVRLRCTVDSLAALDSYLLRS